jgi:hypothetical protein
MSKRLTLCVVLLLGAALAARTRAVAAQEPAAPTVAAWKEAGAAYAGMKVGPNGPTSIKDRERLEAGEVPLFLFTQAPSKLPGSLPSPGTPFGLSLTGSWATDAQLRGLGSHKQLRWLLLSGSLVTDAGLKELAGLQLHSLIVPVKAKTDSGLKNYLAAVEPPTNLDLRSWKLSEAGLKELAVARQLQHLSLRSLKLTEAGLKHLAELKQLEVLDLSSTPVNDAGLKQLHTMKQLQIVNLRDTAVTDAGVAALQKALPKLLVER